MGFFRESPRGLAQSSLPGIDFGPDDPADTISPSLVLCEKLRGWFAWIRGATHGSSLSSCRRKPVSPGDKGCGIPFRTSPDTQQQEEQSTHRCPYIHLHSLGKELGSLGKETGLQVIPAAGTAKEI